MVLGIRLSERSQMEAEGEQAVLLGTMGEPVYWDYAVRLEEKDVVDFLDLLKKPEAVRFLVTSRQRWTLLRSALVAAFAFAGAMAKRFLAGPRASSIERPAQGEEQR
jgi:hypothetical protein